MIGCAARGGPERAALHLVLALALFATACGRKGPPLPPFVRVPTAPTELTAARRGDVVELQFNVPSANTDGTRPANVERVEVWAFTGPDLKDELLFKLAPKIASVDVKAPRDPDNTVEPEEPADEIEPPVGKGLDQGKKAHVEESITSSILVPLAVPKQQPTLPAADEERPQPLLGPPPGGPLRTYVAIGFGKRGRRGPISNRVRIPLVPPPPPPSTLNATYDETYVTVTWVPPSGTKLIEPATDEVLPSTPIGMSPRSIGYHVYDVSPVAQANAADPKPPPSDSPAEQTAAAAMPKPPETRLTSSPVADPKYGDSRITWGAERCYIVRTVETIDGLSLESTAAEPTCVTLVDTFPPAAPQGLNTVASEGAINLIWQPSGEKDLAGYLLLRGATAETLEPITPGAIQDTTYKDPVAPGARYVYAVKAVDKAGNESAPSKPQEATAPRD